MKFKFRGGLVDVTIQKWIWIHRGDHFPRVLVKMIWQMKQQSELIVYNIIEFLYLKNVY